MRPPTDRPRRYSSSGPVSHSMPAVAYALAAEYAARVRSGASVAAVFASAVPVAREQQAAKA